MTKDECIAETSRLVLEMGEDPTTRIVDWTFPQLMVQHAEEKEYSDEDARSYAERVSAMVAWRRNDRWDEVRPRAVTEIVALAKFAQEAGDEPDEWPLSTGEKLAAALAHCMYGKLGWIDGCNWTIASAHARIKSSWIDAIELYVEGGQVERGFIDLIRGQQWTL